MSRKKMIKLFDPFVGFEEEKAIKQVLHSGFWASGAAVGNVLKFENEVKKYLDSKSCVAVNSGTAALNLSLSLFNIKNKEVIVPSLTFVSTVNAIIINGGKPIFVDVEPKTLCLDPEKISQLINKKTIAILPVHFAGMPCNIDLIERKCRKNKIYLIEDAAHAFGASYNKKKIGKHGDIVCFSFHPVKNLAMPNGGLISINNKNHEKIKNELLSKRWCGITDRRDFFYDVKEIGNNYYMNEFSAAIGRVQLKKIENMNKIRKKIAKVYEKELEVRKKIPFSKNCSYHIYWIMIKNRKSFMEKMKNVGIETGIHYKPVHTMTKYKNSIKLPVTEKVGKEIVSIPIHPNLDEVDIRKIIKYINKFAE